jgi:acyl-CoA thioesterase-1
VGALLLSALLAGACNRDTGPVVTQTDTSGQTPAATAPAARTGAFEIVCLGDSLTSGYGLLSEQAYPQVVQAKFAADGYTNVEVVNAGVSGDTSAGGLRRVDQSLGPDTRILVVALGGNDALRGLTTSQTHDNLAGIVTQAVNRNVAVLIAGIQPPTNYGDDYRDAFNEIFPRLLSEFRGRVALVPFILEGVAGVPSLNQTDGIHPNADGTRIVAENVYVKLKMMVDSMGGGGN